MERKERIEIEIKMEGERRKRKENGEKVENGKNEDLGMVKIVDERNVGENISVENMIESRRIIEVEKKEIRV